MILNNFNCMSTIRQNSPGKRLLSIIGVTLLFSCSVPKVMTESSFRQEAESYSVKGRNGLMIKQKLSFGEYQTGFVKRGWTSSYRVPFIVTFSGASEKVSFSLRDSMQTAIVHCLGQIRNQEIVLLQRFFMVPVKHEDTFAGNLHFVNDTSQWNFLIQNAFNSDPLSPSEGFASSGERRIEIKGIREMNGKNTFLSRMGIYGYELSEAGRTVAVVDLLNKGEVTLRKELQSKDRLLYSALCASLLIRRDLNDVETSSAMN
jgi:hypothetical protein